MRSQMEKKYDLIMRQGYGTADVGCIGYECFHKTGLHIANRCYVEICHPDTGIPLKDGEVGEIVVTAFNKTYPLIRLATGDLSYIDRSPCACGRTSPRLGNIVGRVDTTARIMGMFVYPHQVEQVMSRFEEVKRWQIEVTNPGGIDEMTLFIETQRLPSARKNCSTSSAKRSSCVPNSRSWRRAACPRRSVPSRTSVTGINPVMEARPLRRAFCPVRSLPGCPARRLVMEMSPQLARLVAWLEEMHARVMQAEQAALAVMGDMPAYTARMQEKARLLASLEEEGEAYLEELPEQLQDQAGHRLHRFSASARNALRIGSIFYMSALLYPEDHKPGQPDDLQVFIRRLRDEGEHYTLHPQD